MIGLEFRQKGPNYLLTMEMLYVFGVHSKIRNKLHRWCYNGLLSNIPNCHLRDMLNNLGFDDLHLCFLIVVGETTKCLQHYC